MRRGLSPLVVILSIGLTLSHVDSAFGRNYQIAQEVGYLGDPTGGLIQIDGGTGGGGTLPPSGQPAASSNDPPKSAFARPVDKHVANIRTLATFLIQLPWCSMNLATQFAR